MAMLRLALSCLVLQPELSDDEDDFPGLFDYANDLPGLAIEEAGLQPGLSDEEDDVLSIPDDDGLAEDVVQFFEQLGPMSHKERLKLMKASFGIPREPQCYCDVDLLPECTRDLRNVGDQVWHSYYRMNKISETDLPPMRYTQCEGTRCFHEPTPILQIFNMKFQSCQADLNGPINVYGIVAVRDGEDCCRNYLFNRSRENPHDISNRLDPCVSGSAPPPQEPQPTRLNRRLVHPKARGVRDADAQPSRRAPPSPSQEPAVSSRTSTTCRPAARPTQPDALLSSELEVPPLPGAPPRPGFEPRPAPGPTPTISSSPYADGRTPGTSRPARRQRAPEYTVGASPTQRLSPLDALTAPPPPPLRASKESFIEHQLVLYLPARGYYLGKESLDQGRSIWFWDYYLGKWSYWCNKFHSNLLAMDVSPVSLPLSNIIPSSEGFENHDDALPSTLLGPQLLYASTGDVSDSGSFSFSDDDDFCDMLDDNIMATFEGVPIDDLINEDASGVVERIGLVEILKRLLLRSPFEVLSESICYIKFHPLPESSRDMRHAGDLCWHEYYRMNDLSETNLPPKRYTDCDPSTGQKCYHEPSQVFQLFDMNLQSGHSDTVSPIEVYGVVAVCDGEDYRRNYLFNRPRDNPLTINATSDLLRLMSPKRAMSMKFNCLIEVDIRVKSMGEEIEDYTLVDGCMEFVEDRVSFDTFFRCSMDGPYGVAIFDLVMYEYGVEATIELEFLKVPETDGFEIQMCGYTLRQKKLYPFIDKNRECNSFVSKVGRFSQHFVAVMQMDDMLCIDFAEGGASCSL